MSNGSVFVEDVDVQPAAGVRVVQLTPAGSACSIGMGTGLPAYDEMAPGTIKGLHLVVADISAISVSPLKLQLNPASCTVTGAASFLTLTSSLNQRTRYCS